MMAANPSASQRRAQRERLPSVARSCRLWLPAHCWSISGGLIGFFHRLFQARLGVAQHLNIQAELKERCHNRLMLAVTLAILSALLAACGRRSNMK